MVHICILGCQGDGGKKEKKLQKYYLPLPSTLSLLWCRERSQRNEDKQAGVRQEESRVKQIWERE